MKGKGAGFGMVMLVVVMAIVLLLVAKAWKKTAPTALQIDQPEQLIDNYKDRAPEAVDAVGTLPDLNQMRRNTSAHAQEVADALAETE